MKDGTRVLIALIAALVAGIAIAASGNARLLHATDIVVPVGVLWVNAIRMTVIPLVVSLLITGIASASDVRGIGRIGMRALLAFVGLLGGAAALTLAVVPIAFRLLPTGLANHPPLPPGAAEAAGQIGAAGAPPTLVEWFVSLIPANPVAAASNGSFVALIVFTVLLALAIARSPAPARERLVGFFEALRDAMLVLVRWIIACAPVAVFALLLPLAAHSGSTFVGGIGFYIAAYSVGCIVLVLLLYPAVAVFGGVPMGRFARAALPAQLIAFSSSSSVATLPALVEAAEAELQISNRVAGFVVPLAVSMFKIAAPLSWTVGALFVGWFYRVPLSARDVALIAFAGVALGFASPGVPRGAFIMLTPLFLAVGLPAEGIGVLIAVDTIPDLFATVLNTTGDLAATVLVARGENRASR